MWMHRRLLRVVIMINTTTEDIFFPFFLWWSNFFPHLNAAVCTNPAVNMQEHRGDKHSGACGQSNLSRPPNSLLCGPVWLQSLKAPISSPTAHHTTHQQHTNSAAWWIIDESCLLSLPLCVSFHHPVFVLSLAGFSRPWRPAPPSAPSRPLSTCCWLDVDDCQQVDGRTEGQAGAAAAGKMKPFCYGQTNTDFLEVFISQAASAPHSSYFSCSGIILLEDDIVNESAEHSFHLKDVFTAVALMGTLFLKLWECSSHVCDFAFSLHPVFYTQMNFIHL